jgi:hypothetical protein
MKYFTKYLSVDGEIKEGDKFLDNKLGICTRLEEGEHSTWILWEGGKTNIHLNAEYRKVKLFLCSRDIQVGDIAYNVVDNISFKVAGTFEGISYTSIGQGNKLIKECIKVIGEVSPEAVWVTEGMEFDEEDLGWALSTKDQFEDIVTSTDFNDKGYKSLKRKYVKFKCPTCKTFH